jgi:hypothetical protein
VSVDVPHSLHDTSDVDVMSSPTSGHSGPDRPPPDPSDQPLLLGSFVKF